jgi:hypothetical protein
MTTIDLKTQIEHSIMAFSQGNLRENGIRLLKSLGYVSDRQVIVEPNTLAGFVEIHPLLASINKKKALVENWLTVDILLQLTGEDLKQMTQGHLIFDKNRIDNQIIESYLFVAIELKPEDYSRTKLADVTREVNRFFAMPVMILFKYGDLLTLSIINRRLHKKDETKDVLEKVTLIKGINIKTPIRAHKEILFDLSLPELEKGSQMHSFVELHRAWQKTLDISELNKRFYREIANWYFYAVEHVEFPKGTTEDRQTRNATNIIRLITRLIFVWFIKEKGLVPEALFNPDQLKEILNFNDPQNSTYYKAILQNLFFATLNTEMGPERRFRGKNKNPNGLDAHHGISTVYRFENFFKNPTQGLSLFAGIPFLNGGLFECLDKREEKILVDGFSDDQRNQPIVPDSLFFGDELTVDMSEVYGDKHYNKEKVRGLIRIFDSYKFTIEENTPLDEEIALDPELLGKVFENLLAAYNPETGITARKQTGSFYTPREIVNYMVDESLIAYLQNSLQLDTLEDNKKAALETNLRHLLAYNNEPHQFTKTEEDQIVSAIDKIKVLDPACGSGAFPMGVLHKLVFILNKLDPGNVKWKERQVAKASEIPDATVRDQVIEDIEKSFTDNELDYGRKLYLIENCIYGVDIQPIAVQIAKLRFFISLVVDQNANRSKPNLGIRPLPNLESKFVAANTLIGIDKPQQMLLHNPVIDEKEKLLAEVRDSLFTARTPATKRKYRELDKRLREEIAELLKKDGWGNTIATQLSSWDPYDQNGSGSFFDPEWMFGIATGFDVVIGNPPYGADLTIGEKSILDARFSALRTSNKNSAIYFIYVVDKLLHSKGINCFIIPKSLCYSAGWNKCAQFIIESLYKLIDMGKAFDQVLLEQIVLIRKKGLRLNSYINGIYVNNIICEFDFVPKVTFSNYNVLLAGQTAEEIQVIDKVLKNNNQIWGQYVSIERGLNWQSKAVKNKGKTPIYRGAQLDKFVLNTPSDFINLENFSINEFKYQQKPKILNQLAIAHVINPYPHFFLQAGLDQDGSVLVYETISCTFITHTNLNILFALGLNNSKMFAWLLYKFVFSNAIRSTRYDGQYVGKIPIPRIEDVDQSVIIKQVNQILDIKNKNPNVDTTALEAEIDRNVYKLYGLSDDEIAIVEGKLSDSKRKIPPAEETADEIIDGMAKPIEIIDIPIQSDYDIYKCGLCGKLIIGHDRENHSKENHHGQSEWNKLKK